QREIFPLLLRRPQFADASRFRLYDFVEEDGAVNEDVIAYTNVVGGAASLVAYHNRFADTSGRLHLSVPVAGEGGTTRQTLFEALGLEGGPGRLLAFRDHHTGLEHLVESDSVRARGLELTLRAYGYTVLLDLREVSDSAEEPYRQLASHLSGRGVPHLGAA